MRLSLALLVYNEIAGLRVLFERIPFQEVDEIFAIDGGSTDGSIEFLRARGITVHLQETRGRGEAFRQAFQVAKSDAVLFFGPDGNESPADIPKFRPLLDSGYALVIANRMTGGGRNEEDVRRIRPRKWANRAFSLLANLLWNRGKYVHDTLNGFRAITREAWDLIAPDGSGYTIEYQISIRAMKERLGIREFATIEPSRIDGRVGSPGVATGLAHLRMLACELGRSGRVLISLGPLRPPQREHH